MAPEPPGLAVCSQGIFTTVSEAEQAVSRSGAGPGHLESYEWAGASVLQRLLGQQGWFSPSPHASDGAAGLGWAGVAV